MEERSVDCEIHHVQGNFLLKSFKAMKVVNALVLITSEQVIIKIPSNGKADHLRTVIERKDLVCAYQKQADEIHMCCYPYKRKLHEERSGTRIHLSFTICFSSQQIEEVDKWMKALQHLMNNGSALSGVNVIKW